jgi:hypothetical protein
MPAAVPRCLVLSIAALGCACARGNPQAARDRPIAPVQADAPSDIDAAPLDELLSAHWRAVGVQPAPAIDDAAFLRRASLDLLGRIPTIAELDAIAADPDPDRRAHAVDRMLASAEHAEHLATQTADLLLGRALQVPPPVREGTRTWLQAQFAADAGWDATTRAVLTAEGERAEIGAGGFLLAHGRRGRLAPLAGESARVFLGASIACAQCHDHPDDASFTQRDFYGFVAFFARTRVRPVREGELAVTIVDRRRGEARLPLATDAPEEPSGEVVAPSYFGSAIAIDDPLGRRRALADAIVQDDAFARAYVNRTWAQLFGRGWITDVDALPRKAAQQPVLDHLAKEFVASGYDVDALLRRIVLSSAYARSSRADGTPKEIAARIAAFAQADVRPIGPEPLLRSLAVVAGIADGDGSELDALLQRKRAALRELRFAFADDEGAADDDGGSVPQALLLQNGDLVQQAVKLRPRRGLGRALFEIEEPQARVDALVRTASGRTPSADERARVVAMLDARGGERAAYEDVLAALVLSSEFLTNH